MLASGQISLGLAEDGLMPALFARKNQQDAPYWGLLVSCCGIAPLLFLTASDNLAQQMSAIIDFSVIAFLFVYGICCLALLRLLWTNKQSRRLWHFMCGIAALAFCAWVIYETPFSIVLIACLFSLSGLPVFLWRQYRRG